MRVNYKSFTELGRCLCNLYCCKFCYLFWNCGSCFHIFSSSSYNINHFFIIKHFFHLHHHHLIHHHILIFLCWDALTFVTSQSVKRIIETRWSARGDAACVLKKHFFEIKSVLEKLTCVEENTATELEAGLLLDALQSFLFLCFLGLWEPVLLKINDKQIYL